MNDKLDGFICYWRIENFILRRSNKALFLESPIFQANILDSTYAVEISQEKPDFIGLFLCKKSNPVAFKAQLSFYMLTSSGWITIEKFRAERYKIGSSRGTQELISWLNIAKDEWKWLPYGSLTICVQIESGNTKNRSAQCLLISRMTNGSLNLKHLPIQYMKDLEPKEFLSALALYPIKTIELKNEMKTMSTQTEEERKTESTQTEEISPFKDREDMLRFFKEKDFDFVTLRTTKKDFTVHKAVLCTKSPVFNAMFERRMLETENNLVDIQDIDSETLALLVRYLHFEPLKHLQWEEAVNLYYAADKYQIAGLKETCLIFLKKELSLQTVCDAFIMADLHQDENFWHSAFEYFCSNWKVIYKSDTWKNLLRDEPKITSEILEKLADKI